MAFFSRRRNATGPSLLSRLDQEVQEEIRFHLEMRVGELEAEGHEPKEALRRALEAFGDPEEVVEETRREAGRGLGQGRGGSSWPA